jgi:filamentous hemagglutinin family protein
LTVFVAALSLVVLTGPGMSQAQTTDITSSGLNTVVSTPTTLLNGMINHDITGGSRPGNGPNLFHSFGEFSVGNNHIANFLNETATPTTNILSRVTGGNPSNIFGLLQTTDFGAANLYLINPAGVIFGPTASLNVGGSFAASTADYLKMADGATFSTNPAQATVLSIAPVVAFGFLSGSPAPIIVQGSTLGVPVGQTLSVVGGAITIQGDAAKTALDIPTLKAPSGRINLASVASPGEVVLGPVEQGMGLQMQGFTQLGSIAIQPGSYLSTAGNPGGTIVLRGGRLTVDGAYLFADALGTQNGAPLAIDIQLTGDAVITNGSFVTADAGGAGNAGNIQVMANNIELSNQSELASRPFDTGNGGNLVMQAQALTVASGARVSSSTYGPGQGGTLTIKVDSIALSGMGPDGSRPSGVFADAQGLNPGAGSAGAITLQAQTLTVSSGARVSSSTFGPGQGGTLTIKADSIALSGMGPDGGLPSGVFADAQGLNPGAGSAGAITLQAQTLTVAGGAGVSSSTFGPGQGGAISIKADSIALSGVGSDGITPSGVFVNSEGKNTGTGSAGAITLQAQTLTVADGAEVSSNTFGPGQGGTLTIKADSIALSGTSPDGIFSSAVFAVAGGLNPGAGSAGAITLQAQTLTIAGGAEVLSNTIGPGQGGTISIKADSIALSGTSPDGSHPSGVGAGTQGLNPGAGSAGAITLQAQTLTIAGGAKVASSTLGPGQGGTISITATDVSMSPDSAIGSNALAVSTGRAGSITLSNADSSGMTVTGGSILGQSVTSSAAGNIAVHSTGDLNLLGTTVSVKNTGPGNAGSIDVTAGNNLVIRNGGLSTESAHASGGNIKLTAPNIIRIVDSTLTSSVQGQVGSNGGNITIDPQLVVIQNSQLLANANAGAGGNITIAASGAVLVDPNSRLSATAGPAGVSGSVNINSPIQVLGGTLGPLKLAYSQAGLSGDRCAADPTGQFSSFVQAGRDGMPQIPGALSPSPLSFLETLTSGSWGSQVPSVAAARLGLDSVSYDNSTLFRFHSACRS